MTNNKPMNLEGSDEVKGRVEDAIRKKIKEGIIENIEFGETYLDITTNGSIDAADLYNKIEEILQKVAGNYQALLRVDGKEYVEPSVNKGKKHKPHELN